METDTIPNQSPLCCSTDTTSPPQGVLPLRSGKTLFSRISRASVPSSIKSSFVRTPIVRTPGSSEQSHRRFPLQCTAPLTTRVDLLRQFEGIGVSEIRVRWCDSEDEAVFTCDELQEHIFDLVLDVGGLVSHRNLGEPRQVHQRQVQNCRERGEHDVQVCLAM